MILNALEGRPLPIYGDGGNVRDWLHVEDHCAGLLLVLAKGRPGEKYNIGGGNERTNLEIVDRICDALETLRPAPSNPALRATPLPRSEDVRRRIVPATIAATRSTPRRSAASSAGRRVTTFETGSRRRRAGTSTTGTGANACRLDVPAELGLG